MFLSAFHPLEVEIDPARMFDDGDEFPSVFAEFI
jgi:hypothetical protein